MSGTNMRVNILLLIFPGWWRTGCVWLMPAQVRSGGGGNTLESTTTTSTASAYIAGESYGLGKSVEY